MNRVITLLLLTAAVFLLAVSVSGFVSDEEISSTRLGSDFNDSRYRHPDSASYSRAEQVSRRTILGMEAVGGVALLLAGLVLHAPKPREAVVRERPERAFAGRPEAAVGEVTVREPGRVAVGDAAAPRRRRPDGSKFVKLG